MRVLSTLHSDNARLDLKCLLPLSLLSKLLCCIYSQDEPAAAPAVPQSSTRGQPVKPPSEDGVKNEEKQPRSHSPHRSPREGGQELETGARVSLHGLLAKPELNGLGGTVVAWSEENRRYVVLVDGSTDPIMLRAECLSMESGAHSSKGPSVCVDNCHN